MLPNNSKPARISELLADVDHLVGQLTPCSYGSNELLFSLVAKLPRELWNACRQSAKQEPSTTRTCLCYFWSWRWRKKATST